VIIVRYGEIGLKSKGTRAVFERRLVENIKAALGNGRERGNTGGYTLTLPPGRMQ
jgi:adenylyl- and sulfurtransferase ThiI